MWLPGLPPKNFQFHDVGLLIDISVKVILSPETILVISASKSANGPSTTT